MTKTTFKELEIGDGFECYGDIHLNYNYPKICKCIKTGEDSAKEINGISFLMDDSGEVTKREPVGVKTRGGDMIHVGDRVDTVQGTQFEVIRLEHAGGVKYALHDGDRPYDLEPHMSPNLWFADEK